MTRKVIQNKLLLIIPLLVLLSGCCHLAPRPDQSTVVQVSTYPALGLGMYDGDLTYAQLKQISDFGIGTFDGMDGEMVALDGTFYQAKVDGSVRPAAPTMECPFATVHFFHGDRQVALSALQTYDQLKARLDSYLPLPNRPYAFKITGTFAYLKLRSIPKQNTPFPPLANVIAQQTVFEHHNIKGTLVGYWFPEYLADLNVAGYHLHFISEDKQHGGHMLDCSLTEATAEIGDLDSVLLLIPQTETFQKIDWTKVPN
jgi:acetolactate decarboxylase